VMMQELKSSLNLLQTLILCIYNADGTANDNEIIY
jgi:hypothetical protein